MRRFVLTFSFISCFAFGFYPALAHAGWLEFFFPSLREEAYDPSEKMIAPFAVSENAAAKDKLSGLPVNAVSLAQSHRLSSEIAEWAMNAAGDVMNFEAHDFAAIMQTRKHFFDAIGQSQYEAFLREKNVMKVIDSTRYTVRSYVENTPLLLNEGVVNERYRWLFQVPVVMTYMESDMTGYKGKSPITQKAIINMQVGRVDDATKPDGLQIEQWSGKIEALKVPEERR